MPASAAITQPAPDPHAMSCMEVWGGHGTVEAGVNLPGLDVWVLSKPFAQAESGGDVHFVSSCGTGRIARLLLADVSGHGVAVAPIARQLRNIMRRYVNHIEQAEFLSRLNRDFASKSKDGIFATAIAVTFFAPTRTIAIARAGHPRPLLYNAAKKRWRLMTEDADVPPSAAASDAGGAPAKPAPAGLPLGIIEDVAFPAVKLQAAPDGGDMVVLYSDSLIEARLHGSLARKTLVGTDRMAAERELMLGTEGLLAVAQSLPVEPAATFAARLYAAVLEQADASTLDDDATIVVMRPNARGTSASLLAQLGAGVRFLRDVVSFVFGGPPLPIPEFSVANIIGAIIPSFATHVGRGAREL